jgi:acetyl/propionyl-CoA carboxylase alpha subunit
MATGDGRLIMLQQLITTVLVANRAEVALRIQATCHARGLKTVAVYTAHDASLRYVAQATKAFKLTGSDFSAYLNQEELVAIALQAGADALHPGYGFLAENAQFAQRVIDAGLVWLGPSPGVIACMASKEQARLIATRAGVPVAPGRAITDLSLQGKVLAKQAAEDIGFPVMIKDPLGGGGKGMRSVFKADDFNAAWDTVVSESSKHTKTTSLIIEKYLVQARHIEVQIAADGINAIHLFERECSLQRRHQKVIEEAPAQFISTALKQELYAASCRIAKAIGYNSIGTIEFVVTPDEQWYFLEMNTRLQVEHGVTEQITGIDLVDLQINLAQTGKLPFLQEDIAVRGHAIQCRLYAENPKQNFMPSTGLIALLELPRHPAARLEYDLHEGLEITPFFDPMIAKIVSFAASRELAITIMQSLLAGCHIAGIQTNRDLLQAIIMAPFFTTGAFHTQLLSDQSLIPQLLVVPEQITTNDAMLAGLALALAAQKKAEAAQQDIIASPVRRWREQQWL